MHESCKLQYIIFKTVDAYTCIQEVLEGILEKLNEVDEKLEKIKSG